MCRLAVAGAALLSALTLAACSSGGTGATGAIPTTQPPLATTTVPAVTSAPATTAAATTDPPSPAASPTPTAGDAAIFAGLQAYSDAFNDAFDSLDISKLVAALDPGCTGCSAPLAGAIAKLEQEKEHADLHQTVSHGPITKRSPGRACLVATISSSDYHLLSDETNKPVQIGHGGTKSLDVCLRQRSTSSPWRVYNITTHQP